MKCSNAKNKVQLPNLPIWLGALAFAVLLSLPIWMSAQNKGPEFLHRLDSPADFDVLKGKPLNEKYGQVASVKVVLDLRDDRLYFISSEAYEWHFDFCAAKLGFWQSNYLFNEANYSNSANRRFALANINHLIASDRWSLEFSSADQISADLALKLYRQVADSSYMGHQLAIFLNTPRLVAALGQQKTAHPVPVITPDEVYAGLVYQALNCRLGYGYLRRLAVDSLASTPPGPKDIVVLDGPALDIPAVSGLLSPEFQTPLSHLNILCKNRGTPFLAQKGIWDDPAILDLENRLVYFEVFQDSFVLKACPNLAEAERFWAKAFPHKVQKLKMNIKQAQLMPMGKLWMNSVSLVGGKASNFAVLARLAADSKGKWRVPEQAFAIPFYWYWAHFQRSGAKDLVDELLRDPVLLNDSKLLRDRLALIQSKIEACPIDTLLINQIALSAGGLKTGGRLRFRSSTNAEDIEGFNGAGLYESKTGVLGDSVKTMEKAIKQVWASLWNFRAFQEREYFHIDHHQCAMGLLVHRSFPAESANGVAITKNLYRPEYYGFVINVQAGEVSVVSPPAGVICDQLICYSDTDLDFYKQKRVIEYISTSNINAGKPVLTEAQIVLLTEQLAIIKQYYFQIKKSAYWVDMQANAGMAAEFYRYALDIEFKFDGPDNVLYIKQVRPYKD